MLKPVSDKMKKFLALLGETASDHQKQVQEIQSKTYNRAHSTTKAPNVHTLNKSVEAKLTYSEPTRDLVSKLPPTPSFEEIWRPDAYVLFVCKFKCKCGYSGESVQSEYIFLCYRQRGTSEKGDRDNGSPRIYKPVKSLEYPTLPRRRQVYFKALGVCESCFERGQKCQVSVVSPQESIPSSVLEDMTHILQSEPSLPSSQQESTIVSGVLEGDGSTGLQDPGQMDSGLESAKLSHG